MAKSIRSKSLRKARKQRKDFVLEKKREILIKKGEPVPERKVEKTKEEQEKERLELTGRGYHLSNQVKSSKAGSDGVVNAKKSKNKKPIHKGNKWQYIPW